MRAKFQIENPDDVLATITITLPIRDWRALNKQLKSEWPSWKFGEVVGQAIRQAEKVFYAGDEEAANGD